MCEGKDKVVAKRKDQIARFLEVWFSEKHAQKCVKMVIEQESTLAHNVSNLAIRLNNMERLGQSTWIRLKQAQILNKCISAITSLEKDRLNEITDTHNMSVKVVKEARKVGITFSSSVWEKSLKVTQQGTEIVEVLSARGVKSFLKEKSLQLFLLEQLFDTNSTYMLSWECLKNLRNQKGLGKQPIWLEELEEMCQLNVIAEDRQKYELIVFKNDEELLQIGKVRASKKRRNTYLLLCREKENIKPDENEIEQCKGCTQDQAGKSGECTIFKAFKSPKHALNRRLGKDANSSIDSEREVYDVVVKHKEEEIIDEWIEGENVKKELKALNERIKIAMNGLAYTKEAKQAPGLNNLGALLNWLSTSRAEMDAIATALLAVPCKKEVKISNGSILRLIQKCFEEKEIEWKIFKIKAHAGIEGNEYADKLAKEGLKSNKCFKIASSWVKGIRIVPRWEEHIIDKPIRKFVEEIMNTVFDLEWKGLPGMIDIIKEEGNKREVKEEVLINKDTKKKEAVEKVLFSKEKHEKIRNQKLIIQGLVPTSSEKESMTERYFKNKAFEALGTKFHERIWTLRCEAVAEWKELSGIKEKK
ncbi:hypothetical protein C2G38_2186262 [Gigaspora rosea]|uniref:RNase H type-1 domain-containing protein n=1 Tax=Gigaspora rosea TaxID=44941 RepID=A0A397V7E5_9GLOM|nr:hypothetical protein C2G38_2186262 [Gigaspora rosea]